MIAKYFEINGVKMKLDLYKLYYLFEYKNGDKNWREKTLNDNGNGYLITGINYKKYLFHRIVYYAYNQDWDIYDSSYGNTIDHLDRNKLNNNISNLRPATRREQQLNRDFSINAKGYYYNKTQQKYQAQIRLNNKLIHLGLFSTEQEAANKTQKVKLLIKVLKYIICK